MRITFELQFESGPLSDSNARIFVKKTQSDGTDNFYITPDCLSKIEFDEQINNLKKELDAIQKCAHRKFDQQQKSFLMNANKLRSDS